MTFHVGQEVVCVSVPLNNYIGLKKGAIYRITGKGFSNFSGAPCVTIEGSGKQFYFANRFRPVEKRKTDISIFTAMLNPQKTKEPV